MIRQLIEAAMRNTFVNIRFLLVSILCACAQTAFAADKCSPHVGPKPKKIDAIINEADQVIWVRVRSVQSSSQKKWVGENVTYTLDVVQELKGNVGSTSLTLPGVRKRTAFVVDPLVLDASFRHDRGLSKADTTADAMVWRDFVPLVEKPGYCEYAPYFEVGLGYLLILTEPYSLISFEPILSPWDPWLARVERATRSRRALDKNP
ncbi:MAG: hypothetical protein SGI91_03395 [Alphaproteobacteria bacterium]|nr:hypothetical protein [Alphaproteobacteria bacterium]